VEWPDTYALGNPTGRQVQVPLGSVTTPTLVYRSYAVFQHDVSIGAISSSINAVMYDPEKWSYTPLDEQRDPAYFLSAFARLARAAGLKVIESPARDLVTVAGGVCTRQSTESVDHAFLRCGLIQVASSVSDVVEVQAQADQTATPRYSALVVPAASDARAVNPRIVVLSGVTTMRPGDSIQNMVAAAAAVRNSVSGFWLNVHGTDRVELEMADGFLRHLT
jgi:hypothetical protein